MHHNYCLDTTELTGRRLHCVAGQDEGSEPYGSVPVEEPSCCASCAVRSSYCSRSIGVSCCSWGMTTKLLLRLVEDLGEDFTEACSTACELLLLLLPIYTASRCLQCAASCWEHSMAEARPIMV